jgi:hypothetical protein
MRRGRRQRGRGEGEESDVENQRGPSRRGRCKRGGVGGVKVDAEGAESEG